MSERQSDPSGFNESVIDEFRANGGVVGGELANMPLLLLTTIDTRSGQPRTTPLAYHRRRNRYLIIASNGGAANNPPWFRNLERDPCVTVEVGVGTFAATATILEASERDAVFATIVAEAPAAATFQAKAGRTIPVIELAPLRCRPSNWTLTRGSGVRFLACVRMRPASVEPSAVRSKCTSRSRNSPSPAASQ